MTVIHTDEPVRAEQSRTAVQSAPTGKDFASRSVARHLARGAVGFGLIAGAVGLVPVLGPAALLAAPLALIAFRGCPTCWLIGLAQTVSRGRLERRCADGVCTLTKAHPRGHSEAHPPYHR
ncbi:hypothetical protein [Streptomyces longispororuber]|uniref:hypothetical protein n=1 Tax=Streptomyces longispororuber TaxID=68230 RepID=UPI00210AA2AE|nr:hypothetical protein [Streptomyces longispororuber]MCQ4212662.1 hypothetical protein [Streptomyces longispororuber]